mmetsp:Transcript_86398/g.186789  ORF Transcript_86398/g.186789 Transcript_86398/m.186789 type:complete len:376 (-) Transcript_86398:464-1591(-)
MVPYHRPREPRRRHPPVRQLRRDEGGPHHAHEERHDEAPHAHGGRLPRRPRSHALQERLRTGDVRLPRRQHDDGHRSLRQHLRGPVRRHHPGLHPLVEDGCDDVRDDPRDGHRAVRRHADDDGRPAGQFRGDEDGAAGDQRLPEQHPDGEIPGRGGHARRARRQVERARREEGHQEVRRRRCELRHLAGAHLLHLRLRLLVDHVAHRQRLQHVPGGHAGHGLHPLRSHGHGPGRGHGRQHLRGEGGVPRPLQAPGPALPDRRPGPEGGDARGRDSGGGAHRVQGREVLLPLPPGGSGLEGRLLLHQGGAVRGPLRPQRRRQEHHAGHAAAVLRPAGRRDPHHGPTASPPHRQHLLVAPADGLHRPGADPVRHHRP